MVIILIFIFTALVSGGVCFVLGQCVGAMDMKNEILKYLKNNHIDEEKFN